MGFDTDCDLLKNTGTFNVIIDIITSIFPMSGSKEFICKTLSYTTYFFNSLFGGFLIGYIFVLDNSFKAIQKTILIINTIMLNLFGLELTIGINRLVTFINYEILLSIFGIIYIGILILLAILIGRKTGHFLS